MCSKVSIPLHHCSVDILFAVVAIINWKSSNSAFSQISGNLVHGHVAIITEIKYRYVMFESILWFNGVGVVPGLILPFFCSSKVNYAVKKRSRRRPGDGLLLYFCNFLVHTLTQLVKLWICLGRIPSLLLK